MGVKKQNHAVATKASQVWEQGDAGALIQEMSAFVQARVADLERQKMLTLTEFSFSVSKKGFLALGQAINARERKHWLGSESTRMGMDMPWGFLGLSAWARKKDLEKLGKQAFFEKHWEGFARGLFEIDAVVRHQHKAPLPEGLAARQEALDIAQGLAPSQDAQITGAKRKPFRAL